MLLYDEIPVRCDPYYVYCIAQGGMYVLVTVEPEGVVAIPNVQEREEIIFNIGSVHVLN